MYEVWHLKSADQGGTHDLMFLPEPTLSEFHSTEQPEENLGFYHYV